MGIPDFATTSAIVLLSAACFVLAGMYWNMQRAVRQLRLGAARFAQGDLREKIKVNGPWQVARVARSFNRMADQLQQRLDTVENQRNELDAILTSMAEGVLAVDRDERIISLNRAAGRMLGINTQVALGRNILEVIRNTKFHDVITQTLVGEGPIDDILSLRAVRADASGRRKMSEATIELHSTTLRDTEGHRIGVLVMLNDVTDLRRLESVRQDFVANVSHELKTPVSAIKGAAETLMEIARDNGDHEQFLRMIARQSDRLSAIIEDLLSLARIEQSEKEKSIDLFHEPLRPVLAAALETCLSRARDKQIDVQLDCPPDLIAPINAALLEQAVVNLLDNAIKYSVQGNSIQIRASLHDGEVLIAVTDHGCGIEAEHLPRLFERFYRTDRARSRVLGGTGLGLSIVNHIAQAHRGRVSVVSTPAPAPSHGSTFRMHLPLMQSA